MGRESVVRLAARWGVVAGVVVGVVVAGGVPAVAAVCDGERVPCRVGDTGPGGGVVFYDAGSSQSWGRYLEVAPKGWSGRAKDPGHEWCADDQSGYDSEVPTGKGIGSGRANTTAIIKMCGKQSAAGAAAAYTGGGKADWFLPSKDELNELYKQRAVVGGLASDYFWSSSQSSDPILFLAWLQDFNDGYQFYSYKDADYRVRPVRAF